MSFHIGKHHISRAAPPFIVAEIGSNHGGSLKRCFNIINEAKLAGADAVKFQCYEADSITIKSDHPDMLLKSGPWMGWNLYDLYDQAKTPFEWFPELDAFCKKVGITWFSSVFCERGIRLLESLGCPAYKIASCELVDNDLIEMAADTGKPVILSTGLADIYEVDDSARLVGNHYAILHCVSGYPALASEYNLGTIARLMERYKDAEIGLSDHTVGTAVAVAATAVGATIIEKHFTDIRTFGQLDGNFSMTPPAFKEMVQAVRSCWYAFSDVDAASEKPQSGLRRSLWAVQNIKAGERLTRENVRSIRPGSGLPPRYLDVLLSRRAMFDIEKGTPLEIEMFE